MVFYQAYEKEEGSYKDILYCSRVDPLIIRCRKFFFFLTISSNLTLSIGIALKSIKYTSITSPGRNYNGIALYYLKMAFLNMLIFILLNIQYAKSFYPSKMNNNNYNKNIFFFIIFFSRRRIRRAQDPAVFLKKWPFKNVWFSYYKKYKISNFAYQTHETFAQTNRKRPFLNILNFILFKNLYCCVYSPIWGRKNNTTQNYYLYYYYYYINNNNYY